MVHKRPTEGPGHRPSPAAGAVGQKLKRDGRHPPHFTPPHGVLPLPGQPAARAEAGERPGPERWQGLAQVPAAGRQGPEERQVTLAIWALEFGLAIAF